MPMTQMIQIVPIKPRSKFRCSSPLKSIIDEMMIAPMPATVGICLRMAFDVSISFSRSFIAFIASLYSLRSPLSTSSSSRTAILLSILICSLSGFVFSSCR